jgi:hypothetical protein
MKLVIGMQDAEGGQKNEQIKGGWFSGPVLRSFFVSSALVL